MSIGAQTMLEVKNILIDELNEYENNPRKIPYDAVRAVVESIRQFGFKVPVIVDSENVIVAGHTRILAARELGMSEVPCIIADDLTPAQIKAFRLAENKVGELSSWDFEKLDTELEELSMLDVSLDEFGFSVEKRDADLSSEEVDGEEYSDEKFKHECPRCGFKF